MGRLPDALDRLDELAEYVLEDGEELGQALVPGVSEPGQLVRFAQEIEGQVVDLLVDVVKDHLVVALVVHLRRENFQLQPKGGFPIAAKLQLGKPDFVLEIDDAGQDHAA